MIDKNKINITAHAGCMGTEMDSIESIEAGIKYGADIIEIDLNIDEKGNLILCHDEPKNDRLYVDFHKVLEIMKKEENIIFNIDIKTEKLLPKLKTSLLQNDVLNKAFFTGLHFQQIVDNKSILDSCKYFINLEPPKLDITKINDTEYLSHLFDELKCLDIIGVNTYYKLASLELINICKERHLYTSVWTINDMDEMGKMIELKINSITTKNVDILKGYIDR